MNLLSDGCATMAPAVHVIYMSSSSFTHAVSKTLTKIFIRPSIIRGSGFQLPKLKFNKKPSDLRKCSLNLFGREDTKEKDIKEWANSEKDGNKRTINFFDSTSTNRITRSTCVENWNLITHSSASSYGFFGRKNFDSFQFCGNV